MKGGLSISNRVASGHTGLLSTDMWLSQIGMNGKSVKHTRTLKSECKFYISVIVINVIVSVNVMLVAIIV